MLVFSKKFLTYFVVLIITFVFFNTYSIKEVKALKTELRYECQVLHETISGNFDFGIDKNEIISIQLSSTNGPQSKWTSSADSFDFNDAGCEDQDNDGKGGVTSIDAENIRIFSESNACTSHIRNYSPQNFTANSVELFSLFKNEINCDLKFETVPLLIKMPSLTQSSDYQMNFTVTVLSI